MEKRYRKKLGASVFKGILAATMLVLTNSSFAEGSITFLGEETNIEDRTISSEQLLSDYIQNTEDTCLAITSDKDDPEKQEKDARKKQAKCLKKSVKELHKGKKSTRDISKNEKKILESLIKDFKKNGGFIDPEPEILLSTINGRITTPTGAVVASAKVNVIGGTTSIDALEDGTFSLELEAGKKYVLQLTADGYANQVTPVMSPSENGVINLNLTMIARGAVQTFTSEDGATLMGADGAEVAIQANSFVDVNGNAVTGNIDLTITPVDVSNPASLAAFPGEFTGESDGTETPIISFGTVEYQFTQNGNPVQLAQGVLATILIPIYFDTYQDGSPIKDGDFIPLWSLNEETGIWLQEGDGEVVISEDSPTGLAMEATVKHFTWWNCDVSMNAARVVVTVEGATAGTALITATTEADIGFRPDNVNTVADIGIPTPPLSVPSNGMVCFSANVNYADGTSGTTAELCDTFSGQDNSILLTAIAPGPLNIVANGNDGSTSVNGFLAFNISKVRIYPITAETNVTYSIVSGSLPPGLSLNTVDNIRSEIVGVPTTAGAYTVEIGATDNESTNDTVTINFNISSDTPPPELDSFVYLQTDQFNFTGTFDLNDYNNGGLASNWELRWNDQFEQTPPPSEIVLDPATGILTLSSCTDQNGYNISWYGSVFAENASGSSEEDIGVYCSPGDVQ